MSSDNTTGSLEAYVAILCAYVDGSLRLNNAELATHRFAVSAAEYHNMGKTHAVHHELPECFEQIARMSYQEWDAFRYVTALSYLVYATSLLDTFLNDTTKFLLLLRPGAIGKEVKLTADQLLRAKNPRHLLGLAVARKAREVSFGSFVQRLGYLRERFAIDAELSAEVSEQLEHYSSVRNVVVHDQGFIELSQKRVSSSFPSGRAGNSLLSSTSMILEGLIGRTGRLFGRSPQLFSTTYYTFQIMREARRCWASSA